MLVKKRRKWDLKTNYRGRFTSPKLSSESRRIHVTGRYKIGLLSPSTYSVAISSLGYLWAYQKLNQQGLSSCQRFVADPQRGNVAPQSLESGSALSSMHVIAVHIAYELEILNLIRMLEAAGIPSQTSKRGLHHPLIVIGGPLTRSTPRLLEAVGDIVVPGDGEQAMDKFLSLLESYGPDKTVFLEQKHEFVPPPPNTHWISQECVLPVVAPVTSRLGVFGEALLMEVVRGCPKNCTFCVGRQQNSPMRYVGWQDVISAIPSDTSKVGLIGGGLGFYPQLKQLLDALAKKKINVGLSSLRADRFDYELAALLAKTGVKTITVAADGLSEQIRDSIHKGVNANHLTQVACLARKVGIRHLKVYVMIGLPDEKDTDVREFASLIRELSKHVRITLSISPFVPKQFTPLAHVEFAPESVLQKRVKLLKTECRRFCHITPISIRQAKLEAMLAKAEPGQIEEVRKIALQQAAVG